jgi:pSer/pThr/pTyr-binding forkhead associated (FHA) protein
MAVCPNGHDSVSDDFCDTCGMRIGGSPPPGSPQPGSHASGSSPASGAASSAWPDPAASAAEPCPRCGTPRNGQFCEACGHNFVGPRFTPSTASAPPPSAAAPSAPRGYSQSQPNHGTGGYSSSQPGPRSGGYSSGQPGPGSGGYSSAQAPPLQPVPSAPPAPASPSMSSFPYPQATWTAVVGADRAYYEQVQTVTGPEGAAVAFPSYYAERRFQLVGNQMRIGRRSVSRGLAPEIDLTGPPADPGISRLHAVLIATPDGNWAVLDPGSANGTLVNGSEIGVGDQVPLHDGDRINLGAWTAITVHRG